MEPDTRGGRNKSIITPLRARARIGARPPVLATFFEGGSWSHSVTCVTTSNVAQTLPRDAGFDPLQPLPAPAPIVKWAGGKARLLAQLRPLLPPGVELMRHVEPFVGGGAMFFAQQPARALLCDVNPRLVATYEAVRDEVEHVIEHLARLEPEHDARAYYRVRERYNRARAVSRAERSAMFIYLNKTCFNGLHRVNQKGEFNVPVGRYVRPRILSRDALLSASRQLRSAELRCTGFETLLSSAKPGDFVYFDPPYEPVSGTASFTAYAQDGFGRRDQLRLREVFSALDKRGCKLMLSNSDSAFIADLYRDFHLDYVAAARAINCNAEKRGPVRELVVRNY
jgi:DNA adenine methylase